MRAISVYLSQYLIQKPLGRLWVGTYVSAWREEGGSRWDDH